MKAPYKVLSASALSALVAVPALATPAFAQDAQVDYGQADFETLESIAVEDLATIQAQGSVNPSYSNYFNEDGTMIEAPTTVEINDEAVDYQALATQMAQSGTDSVQEYVDAGNDLPYVDQEVEDVRAITPTTVEVTFNEPVESLSSDNVTITDDQGNEAFVDTVELSEDGLSATVNLHDTLQEGSYNATVQIGDATYTDGFPYAVGEIDEIVASDQTFDSENDDYEIEYQILTSTGLDVTEQADVEFSSTATGNQNVDGDGVVSGLEDDESIFVEMTAGDETSDVFQITATASEPEELVDFNTISSGTWSNEDFESSHYIAEDNKGETLDVLFRDQHDELITNPDDVTFESLNPSILIVDQNSGDLTPREPGKADVRITTESGVTTTVTVNVVAEAELDGFAFEQNEDTLEGPVQINPELTQDGQSDATVEVNPIDQYGDDYTADEGENTELTVSVDGDAVDATIDGQVIELTANEAGSATVTVENADGTVSSSFDVAVVEAGEIAGYELQGVQDLDLYAEEDGDDATNNYNTTVEVFPVDENGVEVEGAENATWTLLDEDGEQVIDTAEGYDATIGEGEDLSISETGTYTLEATVGDLVVATETFEVVDSEADHGVSQNTDDISVNTNESLFEAIRNGLDVTQGDNEIASENIQSIEVISNSSQVIADDDQGTSFTLDSGNATSVNQNAGDATLTVTGVKLNDGTEITFDDLYFDVSVNDASAVNQNQVDQAIENAPEQGEVSFDLTDVNEDITIDTEKALDINITGNLGAQNLTVNASNATVNYDGQTTGSVQIDDVSNSSFVFGENATAESGITFADNEGRLEIAEGADAPTVELEEGANATLKGAFNTVNAAGNAGVTLETEDTSVGNLAVPAEVAVEVTGAEGATVGISGEGDVNIADGVIQEDSEAPEQPVVNPISTRDTEVSGTAEPESEVTVEDAEGNVLETTVADAGGNFSVDIEEQEAGTELSVTATDEAGNVSEATTVKVGTPIVNIDKVSEVSEGGEEITVTGTTSNIANQEELKLEVENAEDEVIGSTATDVNNDSFSGDITDVSSSEGEGIAAGEYEVTISYNEEELASHPFIVEDGLTAAVQEVNDADSNSISEAVDSLDDVLELDLSTLAKGNAQAYVEALDETPAQTPADVQAVIIDVNNEAVAQDIQDDMNINIVGKTNGNDDTYATDDTTGAYYGTPIADDLVQPLGSFSVKVNLSENGEENIQVSDLEGLKVSVERDGNVLATNTLLDPEDHDTTSIDSPFNFGREQMSVWSWNRGAYDLQEEGTVTQADMPNRVIVEFTLGGETYTVDKYVNPEDNDVPAPYVSEETGNDDSAEE